MNCWATYLAALSPTLLRAIARANRVSLPRNADSAERLARLRAALCHAHTVRETCFRLPAPARAALWALGQQPRGLSPAEVTARYGELRPAHALREARGRWRHDLAIAAAPLLVAQTHRDAALHQLD